MAFGHSRTKKHCTISLRSRSHWLSLSRTHTSPHTFTHTPSLTHSLTHSLTLTQTHTQLNSHSHSLTLTHTGAVSLRHLNLSNNRFGGKMAKCIGGMLVANKGLLTLSLSGNELHDEVWAALPHGLSNNCTLTLVFHYSVVSLSLSLSLSLSKTLLVSY